MKIKITGLKNLPYTSGEIQDGQKKISWILNGEALNGIDSINPSQIGNLNENSYKLETNINTLDNNIHIVWDYAKSLDNKLENGYIKEAPIDGKRYIRKNGDWYEYINAVAVLDIKHIKNHRLGIIDITPKVLENISLLEDTVKIDNYGSYFINATGKIKSVNKKQIEIYINDVLVDKMAPIIIDGELSIFSNITYITAQSDDLIDIRVSNSEPEPVDENESQPNIRLVFDRVGVA